MKVPAFLLLCLLQASLGNSQAPNIILILADDMGYNDIGYHNPQIMTPYMDQLAKSGVILEHHYTLPTCTPTRSGLLTGMHPIHTRTADGVVEHNAQDGLMLDFKLLPQYLKDAGYANHLVGKWHLGHCNEAFLPTSRGFDSHIGFWEGEEDFYTKVVNGVIDYHDNLEAVQDQEEYEIYATELQGKHARRVIDEHVGNSSSQPLFLYLAAQSPHSPLQVPKEYEDMYSSIQNNGRRIFSGMVTSLDDMIGEVVDKLKETGLYDNSVIIFSSDNGGITYFGGDNTPLRGMKAQLWEGGVRVPAFVHSPLLTASGVYDDLIHVTDWTPTLLELIGQTDSLAGMDGVSHYDQLFGSNTGGPVREEFLYNIYQSPDSLGIFGMGDVVGALRWQNWKYIHGLQSDQLYDLASDPSETTNLADANPDILATMQEKYAVYDATYVTPLPITKVDTSVTVDANNNLITGWC